MSLKPILARCIKRTSYEDVLAVNDCLPEEMLLVEILLPVYTK